MKLHNKSLLRMIFTSKGDFTKTRLPVVKDFDGVKIAPFKNDAKAAVTISADFELSWAFRGRKKEERVLLAQRARKNIPYLLKLLDDFDIPVTWATVGHLFLEACRRGKNGLAHPSMPRPSRNRGWQGDWYFHDPCTNYRLDPLWYAPDLIRQILQARTQHEIATHSFSHVDFSQDASTSYLIHREIEECIRAMAPYGIMPKSLVFPYNLMGYNHSRLLADLGIVSIRHRDPKIRLSYPEETVSGIVKIYESMNTRTHQLYDYPRKAEIYLEKAIQHQTAYHIWFHPSDPTSIFQDEFRRILKLIAAKRENSDLWVTTMGELSDYCRARNRLSLDVDRTEKQTHIQFSTQENLMQSANCEATICIPVKKEPLAVIELINNENRIADSYMKVSNGTEQVLFLNVTPRTQSILVKH